MIRVVNVSKKYVIGGQTITALDDINLEIPPGQIFGIIGQSGAGKSSLIRCLNLLERPTSGRILIDGEDLLRLTPQQLRQARHKIGMIFQHFNLLNVRTVAKNIALPLELMKISQKEIDEKVTELLDLVGLKDKKDYYPSQLSGGQKQRVAIARALATQPNVLLCDEATSALDPQMTQSILELLRDINRRFNITIVLITHEMEVVKQICDQVALLDQGRIVEINNTLDFFIRPKSEEAHRLVRVCFKQASTEELRVELTEKAHLFRITFEGKAVQEPLISELIRRFQLEINILQANIDHICERSFGMMVVEIKGEEINVQEGLAFLSARNVYVEVL